MNQTEEQALIERVIKAEIRIESLKDNQKDIKTDFDTKLEKLQNSINNNHEETKKTIKENHNVLINKINELEDISKLGKGMKVLIGWFSAIIIFSLTVFKYWKP